LYQLVCGLGGWEVLTSNSFTGINFSGACSL
jgi:hypothetical protein